MSGRRSPVPLPNSAKLPCMHTDIQVHDHKVCTGNSYCPHSATIHLHGCVLGDALGDQGGDNGVLDELQSRRTGAGSAL